MDEGAIPIGNALKTNKSLDKLILGKSFIT